ncbi:MAG: FHA domain-containing protein [Anaerolineae bacterium]|jgi:pSer/pThr/pTyr-binding forkhead associated (FHA) protein|nr:FHA domain-containing protein [Anaerolineae bacterium]
MMQEPEAVAKLIWTDPVQGSRREYVLTEGATVTIGRSSNNDIQIPEQHVSRQHAVITYRDGVFMINDLGSSNGTFVNDQKVEEPFPLFGGDTIRLFVPELHFAPAAEADMVQAKKTGSLALPAAPDAQSCLIVTNGAQEGQTIALLLETVTLGRATTTATWEILLQDQSVSRPHARLQRSSGAWHIYDLNSSNGTFVNNTRVAGDTGHPLTNGDTITLGSSKLLFRVGWSSPLPDNPLPRTSVK